MLFAFKQAWHRFLMRHYELMMEDCLCPEERMRLAAKVKYHLDKRICMIDSSV